MSRQAKPFDSYWIENSKGCHIWIGGIGGRGYGYYSVKRVMVRAHRYAYEQVKGVIPEGLTIDHLCEEKLCVNASHLEAVTLGENIKRYWTPQDKCRRGHKNWLIRKDGRGRECRTCRDARRVTSTE